MRHLGLSCALVAAAIAAPAPVALASHELARCNVEVLRLEPVTADRWEAVAVGYVTAPGDVVTVRCDVYVDGVLVAATPTSDATPHVAVSTGRLTFDAGETSQVEFCATYTSSHGTTTRCPGLPWQAPPQWFVDAVDQVHALVEGPACAAFRSIAPGYGPVYVNPQGDVYVDGEPKWDCPPYDVSWP